MPKSSSTKLEIITVWSIFGENMVEIEVERKKIDDFGIKFITSSTKNLWVFSLYKNVQNKKNSCSKVAVNSELHIVTKAVPSNLEAELRVDDTVSQVRGDHVVALGANLHRAKFWQTGVLCICCIRCSKNRKHYFEKLHFDRFTYYKISINLSEEPKSRLYRHGWRTREIMRSSSGLTMKVSILDKSRWKINLDKYRPA